MQMEARMLRQPSFDLRMLMRGVVVEDEVQLALGRCAALDELEELQPLLVAVTGLAGADDLAVSHIESGEKRRRSVPDIVVSKSPCATTLEGQSGLRAVERLDLALLVAAKD